MKQQTMNTIWLWIGPEELRTERIQLEEEGVDASPLQRRFGQMLRLTPEELSRPGNQSRAAELLDSAERLPTRRGFEFIEPDDLASIRKLRPRSARRYASLSPSRARDHILGAWLGRCIGCLLGKPIEGIRSEDLRNYLQMTGQWPLTRYIRFTGSPRIARAVRELRGRFPFSELVTRYDTIDHMPIDDDTNYTTAGLLIVQQHGQDFTPCDVAHFWMQHLPLEATCTAERIAYRNFAMNIAPPASARFRNPFREWIGAQIRADAFGYVNLGNPERAAEFAWRDACISHVKNGIYGEMMMAAAIAAAPYCSTSEEVVRAGLSEIPKTSRLHAAVTDVLSWRKEGITYDEAVARIHKRWDEKTVHGWCHTISNAMICAVALLWGESDFGTSVCRAVQPGFDTDCNGATVGSIFGAMRGSKAIGPDWTRKLNNTLRTSMSGYETVQIDKIAADTATEWKRLLR